MRAFLFFSSIAISAAAFGVAVRAGVWLGAAIAILWRRARVRRAVARAAALRATRPYHDPALGSGTDRARVLGLRARQSGMAAQGHRAGPALRGRSGPPRAAQSIGQRERLAQIPPRGRVNPYGIEIDGGRS
jgi:hypothetical protein